MNFKIFLIIILLNVLKTFSAEIEIKNKTPNLISKVYFGSFKKPNHFMQQIPSGASIKLTIPEPISDQGGDTFDLQAAVIDPSTMGHTWAMLNSPQPSSYFKTGAFQVNADTSFTYSISKIESVNLEVKNNTNYTATQIGVYQGPCHNGVNAMATNIQPGGTAQLTNVCPNQITADATPINAQIKLSNAKRNIVGKYVTGKTKYQINPDFTITPQ